MAGVDMWRVGRMMKRRVRPPWRRRPRALSPVLGLQAPRHSCGRSEDLSELCASVWRWSQAECAAHSGGECVGGVADVAVVSEQSFGGGEERVVAEEVVAACA